MVTKLSATALLLLVREIPHTYHSFTVTDPLKQGVHVALNIRIQTFIK